MKRVKFAYQSAILVLFFCLFSSLPALAVDKIDTEFGTDGFAVKDFGLGDDEALALTVQSDGKILVAGYSSDGAVQNVAVARYLADGTLDTSFSNDGTFTHSLGAGDSLARSIVVLDDGRIIIGGSSFDFGPRVAVIALTPDGLLDAEFADNGQFVLPVDEEKITTTALTVAVDGSIFIGSTLVASDGSSSPVLVKITSTGELDDDFGTDGVVEDDFGYDLELRSIGLVENDRILIAGASEQAGVMQAGLLRRNPDGTADISFGENGELVLDIGAGTSVINDLWIENDGSVLIAGSTQKGALMQAFAARLQNGVLDPDFAGTGLFISDIEYDTSAHGITAQQDGTTILAGVGTSEQGKDLIVWNISDQGVPTVTQEQIDAIPEETQQDLLQNVSLNAADSESVEEAIAEQPKSIDSTVATYIVTDRAQNDDVGYAVVALPSGQVLIAGSSGNGSDKDFVLVRYESENAKGVLAAAGSSDDVVFGYWMQTSPVVSITRVSAVSGGTILNADTLSCNTYCTGICEDSDEDDCVVTCEEACNDKPTISLRGVCYSVERNPVYSEEEEEEEPEPEPLDENSNSIFPGDTAERANLYDIVRSGQTEDGEGLGTYTSEILDITPNIRYYVRAYAVLSDDSVIYGNELSFKTDDACFIATAAYGTLLHNHVVLLREFRDTYLMPSHFGQKIVVAYYHYSPDLADIVRENKLLRGVVQVLLYPLVAFAMFMLKTTLVAKITLFLLCSLLFSWRLRVKQNCHSCL